MIYSICSEINTCWAILSHEYRGSWLDKSFLIYDIIQIARNIIDRCSLKDLDSMVWITIWKLLNWDLLSISTCLLIADICLMVIIIGVFFFFQGLKTFPFKNLLTKSKWGLLFQNSDHNDKKYIYSIKLLRSYDILIQSLLSWKLRGRLRVKC